MAESIVLFEDDDPGYLAWSHAHGDGYVVNAVRGSLAGPVLHRAECWSITRHTGDHRDWRQPLRKGVWSSRRRPPQLGPGSDWHPAARMPALRSESTRHAKTPLTVCPPGVLDALGRVARCGYGGLNLTSGGAEMQSPKSSSDARLVAIMQTWIAEKTGRDDLDCPLCGRSDFGVGAVMFMRSMRDAPRLHHDGEALEGWGVIPAACNFCGYVVLFDFQQCAPELVEEYMQS